MTGGRALRVAVALSGGVDSAVTALLLRRCVPTVRDLRALMRWPVCAATPAHDRARQVYNSVPSVQVIQDAVRAATPWSQLCSSVHGGCCPVTRKEENESSSSDARPVQLLPFHLHSWDDDEGDGEVGQCGSDYDDAERVAHALGLLPATSRLPLVDTAAAYAERCFAPMLRHYAAGATLNVDVLCNSEVKLGAVLEELRRPQGRFAADLLATGHYSRTLPVTCSSSTHRLHIAPLPLPCRSEEEREEKNDVGHTTLLVRPVGAGADLNDQSLFLAYVPAAALRHALFPLGHVFRCKRDVRALAAGWGDRLFARLAEKRTSTGLCFVPALSHRHREGTRKNEKKAAMRRCAARKDGEGEEDGGSCAAARGQSRTCRATFAEFLHDYMAPVAAPGPLLRRPPTRFIDLDAHTELREGGFVWRHEWRAACLPAYCVTLGQKLRYEPGEGTVTCRTYYVCEKTLTERSMSSDDSEEETAGLRQIGLVRRWNDARLYGNTVRVRDVRLPCDAARLLWLHGVRIGRQRCCLRCWCCTRHQDPPQRAWLAWDAADLSPCGTTIARLTAVFDVPVRALTSGQVLVGYLPLAQLGLCTSAGCSMKEPGDWAVVLCGWIV